MTKRVNTATICKAMTVAIVMFASLAAAADVGITVTGSGEAKVKPTSVELGAVVSADAELTADAVVKFNDARKKSMAALEGLKLPNLTISPLGMSVGTSVDAQAQMRMMQGMGGGSETPAKTRISEQLRLVITGADQIAPQELMSLIMKVVDTGRDAGLAVGPPTPKNYYEAQMMAQSGAGNAVAQFKVEDASAVRDEAYKLAMQDARSKAEKLAKLAGVKLGPVILVQDTTAATPDPQNAMMMRMLGMPGGSGTGGPAVSSATFAEIPVRAVITVQFSIEK